MKTVLGVTVSVLALCSSCALWDAISQAHALSQGHATVSQKPALFCLGTYQEGNNITDPRPRESEYLRTSTGGFEIIQDTAGFKLYIDVIKKPERRIYTRAIVPNPQDKNAPFMYEHYLDPTTRSTTITHGPVMGLKVYEDYAIDLILYKDEARTQEIDRLSQKIRSYVDTTGAKAKVSQKPRPAAHVIEHEFDGRDWTIGHEAGTQNELISEWVLPDESVHNWSELVTHQTGFRLVDLPSYVQIIQQQLAQGSKDFRSSTLRETPDSIVFQWSHKGSGNWPAQRAICHVMRGSDGTYSLQYAVKEAAFSAGRYERWRQILLNSKLGATPQR